MLSEPLFAVIISDGYGDYLEASLSCNRPFFEKCVVVTSPQDEETHRIAGKYDCTLIITEKGRKSSGEFNKGLMIERGLQQLPHDGWRMHIDADIVLPGNVRDRLGTALHDKSCIYGADRMNIVGWDAWQKLLASGWVTKGFESQHFLNYSINRAEIGGRLIYGSEGWVPIGFLQIWHSTAEFKDIYRVRGYPTGSNSAAHDDVQFALRWDRHKRVLIPEFLVAHLLTDDVTYGKNWKGRATKRFESPKKQQGLFESNPPGLAV